MDVEQIHQTERPEPLATQDQTVRVFTHAGRDGLTPVYGTAAPPRGLSGLIRRWAYRVPEHHARHFGLLLLADRVDALEHGVIPKLPFAAGLLVTGGLIAAKVRRAVKARA